MVWHADLAPFDNFGAESASSLLSVGWLTGGRPFLSGRVERAVYERLVEFLRDPWQPAISFGYHRCELCLYKGQSENCSFRDFPRIRRPDSAVVV